MMPTDYERAGKGPVRSQSVVPWKTDVLFRLISLVARGNPLLTGIVYFVVEFVLTYIIGLLTGQLHGKNGLAPMYSRVLDNFMMGFLAPVGAGLLCHLYNTISATFESLWTEKLIDAHQAEMYQAFLSKLNRLYNSTTLIAVCVFLSFPINLYNYFSKTESWLGINGGMAGIYGRFFVGVNYFLICLAISKCVITIWALHRSFRFDLRIRPFHPDRSGGLKALGHLAIALNYFVTLLLVYFTLLLVFDEFARQHLIYTALVLMFYPVAVVSFFGTLSGAHKKMLAKKTEVLEKLGATFDHYYQKLLQSPDRTIYDLDSADEIAKIHGLYEIAEKMPVWPFDKDSLVRIFSSLALPVGIFLINLLVNADSIIYNLDKLKVFLAP